MKKVDSNVDGIGAADSDHRIPDYYQITVQLSIPACATARLGVPATSSHADTDPYVYQTSIDESGRILTGSLTVQACKVTNQVDERMSINGCSAGGTSIQMAKCPPSTSADNPEVNCEAARLWAHRAASTGSPNIPSDWMDMQRANTGFTLSGPGGTIGSGSARHTTDGWVFDNLKSGSYHINNISIPGGMELWKTKMIPASSTATSGMVTVQPDITSRALIMFRPKRTGTLNMHFQHRDRYYHAQIHHTGLIRRKTKIPTLSFAGDSSIFRSDLLDTMADLASDPITRINESGQKSTFVITSTPLVDSIQGNCYVANWDWIDSTWTWTGDPASAPAGDLGPGTGAELTSSDTDHYHVKACTWYDLDADYTYYTPEYDGYTDFAGAVANGSYSLTPAPTYRDVVTPAQANDALGNCPSAFSGPVLMELVNANCVTGRSTATAAIRDISTGLNTRLMSSNTLVTTYRHYDTSSNTWDQYGNNYTVDANDNISHVLGAWTGTRGVWVTPSGGFVGSSGSLPSSLNLLGYGKCFWLGTAGPCGGCNVMIPGTGTVASCYVLTHVHWKRTGYLTVDADGGWGDRFDSTSRDPYEGDNDVVEGCSGPPAGGDEHHFAPNCSSANVNPPSGGHSGGFTSSGTGGSVSSTTFSNVTAQPTSGATSIGVG